MNICGHQYSVLCLLHYSLGEDPSDRSAVDRTGCFQSAKLAIIMSLWLQAISISIFQGVRALQRLFCFIDMDSSPDTGPYVCP
jgi:hypothetical protein